MKIIFEIGVWANGNITDVDNIKAVKLHPSRISEITGIRKNGNITEIISYNWKITYYINKSYNDGYSRCEKEIKVESKEKDRRFNKIPADEKSIFFNFFTVIDV